MQYSIFRQRKVQFALTILLWVTGPLSLQAGDVPDLRVKQITTAPNIDGEVLNDPIWSSILPISEFWQTRPYDGQSISERTEVRISFTKDAIYVSVVCFDSDPSGIVIADTRKDSDLTLSDSFQMVFDTFQDHQNGFVFGTNPGGVEYDAQITNEGEGNRGAPGRNQGGQIGGINVNWDGSWTVVSRTHDQGWSAEFEIPFKTLRYPEGREQSWGVNFQRNIRRKNETAYWAPLPRQYNLYRVSLAGQMDGVLVPAQRNLKITPYLLGNSSRDYTIDNSSFESDAEAGLDLKYSLSAGLTLDATINTDFAQVEVDDQQINLDRFSLFFPEKRPFFLENAGLFSVGLPGEVDLFFSRRIGITDGAEVPILGGGRVSGDVAGLKVGFLSMQTQELEGLAGSNNFTVGRVRKELANRSYIGGIISNRFGSGDYSPDDDKNTTFGLDGKLGIGQYGSLTGFLARTATPGESESQHAFLASAGYDSEAWILNAAFSEVAPGFNPEVGFLQRSAYRKPSFLVLNRFRPENFIGLHELRPHISYRSYWDFDGFQETMFLHLDNHWEWRNGWEVHTGYDHLIEGLKDGFFITDDISIDPGSYSNGEIMLVVISDPAKKFSFENRTVIGGFFDGNRRVLSTTFRARASENLTSELTWQRNDVNLQRGDFVANLVRARFSYSFTPRIYLQSLIQYNDLNENWSTNLRLGWLQASNTGLFIVFNQANEFDGLMEDGVAGRSFVIKYSYLFDVL